MSNAAYADMSDIQVLAAYFCEGEPAKSKLEAIKGLSAEEKKQLAEGIRNGTLTY